MFVAASQDSFAHLLSIIGWTCAGLLVTILLVTGFVRLRNRKTKSANHNVPLEELTEWQRARRILEERYAAKELGKDEYERRLAVIAEQESIEAERHSR